MKKYKIILTVLLVVLAAVSALVVSGVFDTLDPNGGGFEKRKQAKQNGGSQSEETTASAQEAQIGADTVFTANETVRLPLMKTDIEGYFYTMDKQGGVKFYSAANGEIKQVPETDAYEVQAECSAQMLKAMVHFIEVDGRTYGCGLFTNVLYPEVNYYAYAFFRVTEMFESYRDARTGANYYGRGAKLLLIDTDSSRFYSDDKVYGEAFVLNSDRSTSLFLSNDQRSPGMDGVDRRDYKMFTDEILDQNDASNVLFFSARNYVDYSSGGKADIMTSGGSDTNIDNVRYVVDVDGLYFHKIGGVVFFFKAKDGGFELQAYNASAKTTDTVLSLTGDRASDYLQSGHYLLNVHTGVMYDLIAVMENHLAAGSSEETAAKAAETYSLNLGALDAGFTANWFSVSQNGRFIAVRGENADHTVSLVLADREKNVSSYTTDLFYRVIANISLLNDGTVIVSVAKERDETAEIVYAQLVCVLG